jgi:hypothetical protein
MMTTLELIRVKFAEAILGKSIPTLEVPRSEAKFGHECTVNASAVFSDASVDFAQVRVELEDLTGDVTVSIKDANANLGDLYLTRTEARKLGLLLLYPKELV